MRELSWLQRFYQKPQQLWLRRATFQVHLWAGVLLALYVAALGLSGSVLVLKDELMPRPHYTGERPRVDACTPAELLTAIHTAVGANPQQDLVLASCPTSANPFFAINLRLAHTATNEPAGERTFYVHPITWQVAGSTDQDASWISWVDRFHMELLLKNNGRQWNGLGAAILLLLVASGLVVWWPGVRHWSRAFTVSLRSKWKRINWDLHSATGIWTVLFSLVWATTTLYFAWPSLTEHLIARASPLTTAHYPAEELARLGADQPTQQPTTPTDLAPVLAQATQLSPAAHLEGVFLGSGPTPILTVYMARHTLGDYANTDFVYFNQNAGRYLFTWHRGANHTAGDWILWSLAPLHFGTSWGLFAKCIWAAAGLALPLLALTGLLMFWNRSVSKLRR